MSIKLLEQVAATRGTTAKAELLATGLNNEYLTKYLRMAWESGGAFGTQPTKQAQDQPYTSRVDDDTYFREVVKLALSIRGKNRNAETVRQVDELLEQGSARQAIWLQRLLVKNLELGVSHKTMETYFAGDAPKRFRIRKCEAIEEETQFKDWIEETKYDGWRVFFKIEEGLCEAYSSSGNVLGTYRVLEDGSEINGGCGLLARDFYFLARGAKFVFDTEVLGASTREDAAVAGRKQVDADVRAVVFDIFPSSYWQRDFKVGWRERRRVLNKVFGYNDTPFLDSGPTGQWASLIDEAARVPANTSLAEFTVVHDVAAARDVASKKISQGFEGIIIKDPDAEYILGIDGTWLKVKGEIEEEFKIVDIIWKRKQPTLKVVLENGTAVLVGGMTAVEHAKIWIPPADSKIIKNENDKWVNLDGSKPDPNLLAKGSPNLEYIGRWARVRYQQRTKSGSLAHPRFAGFRDEKSGGST